MRCPEKSIVKRKVYQSIAIKKLYLMFLKYKQTQPACAKNEHAIDYTQNSFLGSWNQASQIQILDVHSGCLFYYCTIAFILQQRFSLHNIRAWVISYQEYPGYLILRFPRLMVLRSSNLTSVIKQFNRSHIFLLI